MKRLLVGALIALLGLFGVSALHHYYGHPRAGADMYAPQDMYHPPQDMY
jgi:hypothetical protein